MNIRGYDVRVERLSHRLGGGVVAYAPALKGCLADGGTEDEALDNLQDAIHCWLEAARSRGRAIPPPITKLHAMPARAALKRTSAAAPRLDFGGSVEVELQEG